MTWDEFLSLCIPEPHTVVVEAYTGSGPYGPVYGEPVPVDGCVIDDTARLVPVQTQDAAGATRLSSTTVDCPPATVAPVGSRVTLPSGRVARVLTSALADAHGWDLPEHLEITLE